MCLCMLYVEQADIGRIPQTKGCHPAHVNFAPYQGGQPDDRRVRPLTQVKSETFQNKEIAELTTNFLGVNGGAGGRT